jgi:hypothetical protein
VITIDLGGASRNQSYFGGFSLFTYFAVYEFDGRDRCGWLREGEDKRDWVWIAVVHEFDDFGSVDEVGVLDNAATVGCYSLIVLKYERTAFTHIINKISYIPLHHGLNAPLPSFLVDDAFFV